MKAYLVRGVPMSMQQDGWWLNPPDPDGAAADRPLPWSIFVLVALIALGDWLVWGIVPGLSLAVFSGLCVACVMLLHWRDMRRDRVFLASGVTVLSVLPVVELVQPLSVLFLVLGPPVALLVLRAPPLRDWPCALLRFWWAAPLYSIVSALEAVNRASKLPDTTGVKGFLKGWSLPLGVGALFLALLIQANPIIETLVLDWNPRFPSPQRILMWVGFALILWPMVTITKFIPVLISQPRRSHVAPLNPPNFVNAPAILRSLVLFNVMFAAQNAMDMAFLAGGVGLPEGVSYAQYAHRGAYPLLALALLSGLFALIARPFITANPMLKALLLIWVAQTIWLTCSSLLRLELYIEAYGLTRLRIAAGIWMVLVATGLGMILWQIGRAKSNRWLITHIGALGLAVLYGCCFFSFDRAIAQYNLTHDVPRDWAYLRSLGEDAAPVFVQHLGRPFALPEVAQPTDWREWGFRNARVRASLAALNEQATRP